VKKNNPSIPAREWKKRPKQRILKKKKKQGVGKSKGGGGRTDQSGPSKGSPPPKITKSASRNDKITTRTSTRGSLQKIKKKTKASISTSRTGPKKGMLQEGGERAGGNRGNKILPESRLSKKNACWGSKRNQRSQYHGG